MLCIRQCQGDRVLLMYDILKLFVLKPCLLRAGVLWPLHLTMKTLYGPWTGSVLIQTSFFPHPAAHLQVVLLRNSCVRTQCMCVEVRGLKLVLSFYHEMGLRSWWLAALPIEPSYWPLT